MTATQPARIVLSLIGLTATRFAQGGFDADITDPVNEIGLRDTTGVLC